MNSNKPLIIPKGDKVKNLRPWCKECSTTLTNGKCALTQKRLRSCKFPEQHTYKAYFTVPNSKRERTKELNTKDLSEAIKGRDAFKKELMANGYQSTSIHKTKKSLNPLLLIECMDMYIDFLNNVDVPEHKKVERTKKYIEQVETDFLKWCKAMNRNEIDHRIFKVDQMNDKIVAMIHNYILKDLGHSNKTYNKMMSLYRRFTDWLITKKKYKIENYFEGVNNRYTEGNNEIVSAQEFQTLLMTINPDTGWNVSPSGYRRDLYRPWLSACFRLALETGLRGEEFMTMKFSHIHYDQNGKPLYIQVPNLKVDRIKGEEATMNQGKKLMRNKKFVPITKGMRLLLDELNFDTYKNTDNYLIAPDENSKRSTLQNIASKGFTHYWKLTGNEREIQLKNLRKTYLTSLTIQLGKHAKIVSDHADIDVIKEHYQNQQKVVSMVQNFEVFDYKPII